MWQLGANTRLGRTNTERSHPISTQKNDIVAVVNARLQQSPYQAIRKLSFELTDDAFILQGRVSTFFEKQQAQETIRNVDDRRRIVNEVKVGP